MTGYRLYLGSKTGGRAPWHVETADGVKEAHVVVIHGATRTDHQPTHAFPFAMAGTGRLTTTDVLGHVTIDIWDSEA